MIEISHRYLYKRIYLLFFTYSCNFSYIGSGGLKYNKKGANYFFVEESHNCCVHSHPNPCFPSTYTFRNLYTEIYVSDVPFDISDLYVILYYVVRSLAVRKAYAFMFTKSFMHSSLVSRNF